MVKHKKMFRLLMTFAMIIVQHYAHGANVNWTNAAGGNWSIGGNWSNGTGPGTNDTAVITLAGTYTVNVDIAITCRKMVIGGNSGLQTVSSYNNYYTHTFNNGVVINARGKLAIQYATINANQPIVNGNVFYIGYGNTVNANVTNNDTLEVTHSTNSFSQNFTASTGSVLYLSNAAYYAQLTIANGFVNNGTILHNSVTGYYGTLTVTNGTVNNPTAGIIKSTGLYDGFYLYANIVNKGSIVADRNIIFGTTNNTFTNNNSGSIVVNGTARIQFDNNTFTNSGGTVNITANALLVTNSCNYTWSSGGFPGTGNMVFNNSTVAFNTAAFPGKYLEFNQSTLNSTQNPITNSKKLRFTYNNIINAAIFNTDSIVLSHQNNRMNGALTTSPASRIVFDCQQYYASFIVSRGFTNNGKIFFKSVTGYNASLGLDSNVIINAAGGEIIASNNFALNYIIYSAVNNIGNIEVQSGSSLVIDRTDSSTNTGTINVANNSYLRFNGGALKMNGGSITGVGSGYMQFDNSCYLENLTTIPPILTIFNSSKLASNAALINNTATLQFNYNNVVSANIKNKSTGIINVTHQGNTYTGQYSTEAGSVFSSNGAQYYSDMNFTNGWINNGTLDLSSLTGYATSVTCGGEIQNNTGGVINCAIGAGGQRYVYAQVLNKGTWNVNTATILSKSTAIHNNTGGSIVLNGSNELQVQGGRFNMNSGSIAGTGSLFFSNSVYYLVPANIPSVYHRFEQSKFESAGVVNNSTTLRFYYSDSIKAPINNKATGIIYFSHYSNFVTGAFTNVAGSQLVFDCQSWNADASFLNGFTNKGNLTLGSVTGYSSTLTILNGTLVNDTNATFDIAAGAGGVRYFNGKLSNLGTWHINASTYFNSSSLVNEATGTLRGNAYMYGQSVSRLINKGLMYPGTGSGVAIGQLYYQGDVNLKSTSALNVQIGGMTAISQHDQTTTTGTDSLNGVLNISLVNNYVPALGDSFIICNYGTRVGQFSSITGTIPGNLAWNIFYRPTYAVIRAGNPGNLTIAATAGPNGNISPSGNVSVVYNGSQTFNFNPAINYVVDSVKVNGNYVGAPSSYTFNNVTSNQSIHVTFRLPGYTIVASKSGAGTISPSGNVAVSNGASQTFTFTPSNSCTKIDSVIVDNAFIGTPTSYTFSNVSANHTIRVVFGNNLTITSQTGVFAFCAGSTVTINAQQGFNSYVWSNGTTTAANVISSAGTYTVTVSGTNGCNINKSVQVVQNALPVITFNDPYPNTANKVCHSDGGLYLNSIVTPQGGYFTGPAITNNFSQYFFNPGLVYNATNITYTYTDANGCTNTKSKSVTVDSNAILTAGPDIIKCGNTVIPITATKSGKAATTTWTSNGTGTFGNVSALNTNYTMSNTDIQNGTVILTITSSDPIGTCGPVSDQIVVTYYPNAIADAGAPSICTSTSTYLTGTISGYPFATPLWTTTGTGTFTNATAYSTYYNASPADIASGMISVALTPIDPNGQCNFASDTIKLYFDNYSVSAGNDVVLCGTSVANISGTKSNTLSSITWTSNGTGTFGNVNALNTTYTMSASDKALGLVTLSITSNDPNGPCGAETDAMTVTYKYALADAGPPQLCADTIQLLYGTYTGTFGTGAQWTTLGTGTFSNANSFTPTYTASAADKINGKVKLVLRPIDPAGQCNNYVRDTIELWFNPYYKVNAGPDTTFICGDKTLTLAGTRTNTNVSTWSTSGSGSFANASALNTTYTFSTADTAAGLIKIYLSTNDPNGPCGVIIDSMYVVIKDVPKATAGTNSPVCATTNLNLTASGGNGYLWSGPNGFSSTIQNIVRPNANSTMAGTYTVTVTNLIGCSATATTVAVVNTCNCVNPIVQTGKTNVSCKGGNDGTITTTINNVGGPFTYLWSNGQTNATATGLVAGTYTVTVTTTPGCTGTASVIITEPTAINSSANVTNTTCGAANGSIALTTNGGTAPYQYLWSTTPPQNTSVISSLVAGIYTCTITDGKGCTKTISATVQTSGGTITNVTLAVKRPCYQVVNGKLTVSNVTGGTAPYTYLWSNGATTNSISNLAPGAYAVTVTDATGCGFVKNITLNQWSQIKANLTVVNAGCNVCDGIAYAQPTGGKKPYRYSWTTVPVDVDSIATGLCAGSYTLTIRDTSNCKIDVPVVVDDAKPKITTTIIDVLCNGATTGDVNIAVTGGTAPYVYAWSNGKTTKNNLNVGAGPYTVTVTATGGCSATTSATVAQPTAIAIGIDTTATTAKAIPTGGISPYAYVWSNGKTTQKISNLVAGTYTVTVTDGNGCTKVKSVVIAGPRQGLWQENAVSSFTLFPNPAIGRAYVSFECIYSEPAELLLINQLGQMVWSQSLNTMAGSNMIELSVIHLPPGIYELRMVSAHISEKATLIVASE